MSRGLSTTNNAHAGPVSSIPVHPTKPIVATASDDCTWKMWSLSGTDLIMSGDGHKGWLSGIDFAPGGRHAQKMAPSRSGTVDPGSASRPSMGTRTRSIQSASRCRVIQSSPATPTAVRRVSEISAVAAGRHPCNSMSFDPSVNLSHTRDRMRVACAAQICHFLAVCAANTDIVHAVRGRCHRLS